VLRAYGLTIGIMGRFKDFRGSMYGRWPRGEEPDPERFDEWRAREIARVKAYFAEQDQAFVRAMRDLAENEPDTFADFPSAAARVRELYEDGRLPRVQCFGGARWLWMRLQRAGVRLPDPGRRRIGIRLSTQRLSGGTHRAMP